MDAELLQPLRRFRPNPVKAPDRERGDVTLGLLGADDAQTVGLVLIGRCWRNARAAASAVNDEIWARTVCELLRRFASGATRVCSALRSAAAPVTFDCGM